jgi:predicted nucleotidyltransferase
VISEATIAEAVKLLQRAVPRARIILFGSYAYGSAREDSAPDFLVVEPEVKSRRAEMVRLRDVLRP